jgi:hypothetical protein
MAQQGQWIDLDEIINQYIDESEQPNHKFFKLWQIAYRGLGELGIDFFAQIKSVKLPIEPNYTVQLPSDYLNYTKVGILNGQGEVIPLSYNNKLTTYAQFSPDRLSKTQDNSAWNWYSWDSPVWYNYWNGYFYSQLFGIPSGAPFVGSFKIDNNTGVLLLNEAFQFDYIILEYVSSPTQGEAYRIPIQFREALIAYLSWIDIRSLPTSRRGALGDKRNRRSEFYNQRRLAWARYRPFSLTEAYEFQLQNQRKSIKS